MSHRNIDPSRIIVIDTETTGLDPEKDEVLSLAILDGNGNVLFNDYVRPARRKRWPNAARINGITWADVKDKRTIRDRSCEIESLFKNAQLVVGYNTDFDLRMLKASGLVIETHSVYDVMKHYASIHNGGRYAKLAQCARHYGYAYDAHNALEDAKATLHCYKMLSEEVPVAVATVADRTDDADQGNAGCGCALAAAIIFLALAILFLLLH